MTITPTRRAMALAVTVLLAGSVLAACQNGRIGARCRTTDFGQDRTNVLVCKNGRWRKLMTKAQAAQVLIEVARRKQAERAVNPVAQIVTDSSDVCARLESGRVSCWGLDIQGHSGQGTGESTSVSRSPRYSPSEVPGISTATDLDMGETAACVALADTTVRCWGQDSFNQLGNQATLTSQLHVMGPVTVLGLSGATQVAVSDQYVSCALINDGTVRCWGQHSELIGDGSTDISTIVGPTQVVGVTGAVQIAAGQTHMCALISDGTVRCWGKGYTGQLGNGSTTASATPVVVSGANGVTSIDAGVGWVGNTGNTCGTRMDGSVVCWGDNSSGLLQPGGAASLLTPTQIPGLDGATAVSVASGRGCIVQSSGRARCWGDNNSGTLGDGTQTSRPLPGVVVDTTDVTQVSVSSYTTCLRTSKGRAYCMGRFTGHGQYFDTSADVQPNEVVF